MEGAPRGALRVVQDERILTDRQNSSHLFLEKCLCFIFNLSTVISQFSLLGKACQGAVTTLFLLPHGERSPLPKPYSSLESSATSSAASLLGVLQSMGVILKDIYSRGS